LEISFGLRVSPQKITNALGSPRTSARCRKTAIIQTGGDLSKRERTFPPESVNNRPKCFGPLNRFGSPDARANGGADLSMIPDVRIISAECESPRFACRKCLPSPVRGPPDFFPRNQCHHPESKLRRPRHIDSNEFNSRTLKSKQNVRIATKTAESSNYQNCIVCAADGNCSIKAGAFLAAARCHLSDLFDQQPVIAQESHDGLTLRFETQPRTSLTVGRDTEQGDTTPFRFCLNEHIGKSYSYV
jgi:hypothetical protein